MAVSKTVTFGKSGTRPYGVLTVTETATNTANNTSTVSVALVLKRPSAISSSATKTASVTVNGTTWNWSGSIDGSGDKTLISKTLTVPHNTDGSKTINLAASIALNISWSGVSLGTISGSGTLALTKIPRYASVSQSCASKTETTATIKWNSDTTVDYIWYSTNNGSTWSGINVTDGTSGSYTINGLAANTTYQVKTRVRNKSSQLTTDSTAISVTTYAYPYANAMPSFTIGEKLTIGIYNPLKRSVTINILGADGSVCSTDTISGTSISGYNGTTVQNMLYASIPNAKSGTYRVKVSYGSQVTTKNGGTYSIDQNVCLPSIGGGSYQDTNSTTVAITGNNQNIVQNKSTVKFTATGLAAQQSATVSACSVKVNGNTYNLTVSGNTATGGNAVINSGTDVDAVLTVTDSRGLTASTTIPVTMLALATPSAIITAQRQSNFYAETDITVDANYSSVGGRNTIAITYACTKDGDSSPTVSGTLQDNVGATVTLDNNFSWSIQVTLTDRFGLTASYTVSVARGIPLIFFDKLLSSVGINCFPQDENSLEVNGVNLGRNVMTRSLSAEMTNLAVNTYTIIPMNLSNVAGDKLTATNDGGIKIGANVSKVLVSGLCTFITVSAAGNKHVRIMKNSYSNSNTLAWSSQYMAASQPEQVAIMPVLADVQEGDVLYLFYYTGSASDKIGGNAYGSRTSLTVEVVG